MNPKIENKGDMLAGHGKGDGVGRRSFRNSGEGNGTRIGTGYGSASGIGSEYDFRRHCLFGDGSGTADGRGSGLKLSVGDPDAS